MEHIALYRQFRPQTFDDIVEQENAVTTLRQTVISGKIGHAYLFCGTRGTGKTSIAKVFSRAINCEHPVNGNPCNECPTCKGILNSTLMDVIEIDAASNNSVDNVRKICEEVVYAPSKAPYKVYIIDEVHMLSTGAFNALLKTLEEPPKHAVFLLATTEPHKIPATILSRCQRFDFRRISLDAIVKRLSYICAKESIPAEDDALRLIATLSDGALRDSISLLDQAQAAATTTANGNKRIITAQSIEEITGTVDTKFMFSITEALIKGNYEKLLPLCDELFRSGRDLTRFTIDLGGYFRDILVVRMMPDPTQLVHASATTLKSMYTLASSVSAETLVAFISYISNLVSELKWSPSVRTTFEISLLRLCGRKVKTEIPPLVIPDFVKKQAKAAEEISARATDSSKSPLNSSSSLSSEASSTDKPQNTEVSKPSSLLFDSSNKNNSDKASDNSVTSDSITKDNRISDKTSEDSSPLLKKNDNKSDSPLLGDNKSKISFNSSLNNSSFASKDASGVASNDASNDASKGSSWGSSLLTGTKPFTGSLAEHKSEADKGKLPIDSKESKKEDSSDNTHNTLNSDKPSSGLFSSLLGKPSDAEGSDKKSSTLFGLNKPTVSTADSSDLTGKKAEDKSSDSKSQPSDSKAESEVKSESESESAQVKKTWDSGKTFAENVAANPDIPEEDKPMENQMDLFSIAGVTESKPANTGGRKSKLSQFSTADNLLTKPIAAPSISDIKSPVNTDKVKTSSAAPTSDMSTATDKKVVHKSMIAEVYDSAKDLPELKVQPEISQESANEVVADSASASEPKDAPVDITAMWSGVTKLFENKDYPFYLMISNAAVKVNGNKLYIVFSDLNETSIKELITSDSCKEMRGKLKAAFPGYQFYMCTEEQYASFVGKQVPVNNYTDAYSGVPSSASESGNNSFTAYVNEKSQTEGIQGELDFGEDW